MKPEELARLGIDRIEVCLDCGQLRGPWRSGLMQWCDCDRAASPERQPKWPGHDHNTVAELCRCCALVLVRSGSKWSVWLCPPCLKMVRALNQREGRCVFPVGRHSLMNGIGYRAGPEPNEMALAAFSDQLHAFFRATEGTEEWCRRRVVDNALVAGLPATGRLALHRYLSATAAATAADYLSPEVAFAALWDAAKSAVHGDAALPGAESTEDW